MTTRRGFPEAMLAVGMAPAFAGAGVDKIAGAEQAGLRETLLASGGSATVGFIQAGTRAIARTAQDKMRDAVNAFDFLTSAQQTDVLGGVLNAGVLAALQAVLDTHLHVDFGGPANNYKVNGTLTLRSNHVLTAHGATITQTATRIQILDATAKANIRISDIDFVGVGSDFNNSAGSRADAIYMGNGSGIWVNRCSFTNFSHSSLTAVGVNGVWFSHNRVVGMGSPTLTAVTSGGCYGVVVDLGCSNAVVAYNKITATSQGIVTGDSVTSCRIEGNIIHDLVGQHGVYCGGGQINLSIIGNVVKSTSLMGIKVQQYDTPLTDSKNVVVSSNTVDTCGSSGIAVVSVTVGPTYKTYGVTISGNTVNDATEDGINVSYVIDAVINGNVIRVPSREGVSYSACENLVISENAIRSTAKNGIRDVLASTFVTISGNRLKDCCTAATAGEANGIHVQGGSEYDIRDNVITDANAKMIYGIIVLGVTQSTLSVVGNVVPAATTTGGRFQNVAIRQYEGNNFGGTVGPVTNGPICSTVASAAALTLPMGMDVIHVTGVTTITSVGTLGFSGRRVTLIFAGILTVTDGSNLFMAGNFVTTATDTLTIACDGLNWYEVARSVN